MADNPDDAPPDNIGWQEALLNNLLAEEPVDAAADEVEAKVQEVKIQDEAPANELDDAARDHARQVMIDLVGEGDGDDFVEGDLAQDNGGAVPEVDQGQIAAPDGAEVNEPIVNEEDLVDGLAEEDMEYGFVNDEEDGDDGLGNDEEEKAPVPRARVDPYYDGHDIMGVDPDEIKYQTEDPPRYPVAFEGRDVDQPRPEEERPLEYYLLDEEGRRMVQDESKYIRDKKEKHYELPKQKIPAWYLDGTQEHTEFELHPPWDKRFPYPYLSPVDYYSSERYNRSRFPFTRKPGIDSGDVVLSTPLYQVINPPTTPKFIKDFAPALVASKGLIAGGYPLKIVLGADDWRGDLDIWCSENHTYGPLFEYFIIDKWMWKRLGITSSNKKQGDPKKGIGNNSHEVIDYSRLRNTVKSIFAFEKEGYPPVQIIVCFANIDPSYVVKTFDLEICQVAYDGRRFVTPLDPKYFDTLRRDMVTRVSQEAIDTQSFYEWYRTMIRIIKYKKRGITTSPLVWEQFNMMELCPVTYYGQILPYIRRWNNWRKNYLEIPMFVKDDETHTLNFVSSSGQVYSSRYFADIGAIGPYRPSPDYILGKADLSFVETKVPPTCYDVSMLSDEKIDEYLQENPSGCIFIMPGDQSVCDDMERLKASLDNVVKSATDVFYECIPRPDRHTDGYPERLDRPYYLIRLTANYLVPLGNMVAMVRAFDRGARIFSISPYMEEDKQKILATTVSHNVIARGRSAVSANHCQRGSNISVYRIDVVGDPSILKPEMSLPDKAAKVFVERLMARIGELLVGKDVHTIEEMFDALNIDSKYHKMRYVNVSDATRETYKGLIKYWVPPDVASNLSDESLNLMAYLINNIEQRWTTYVNSRNMSLNPTFYNFIKQNPFLKGLARLINFSYTGIINPDDT
jgi:hypothetical protein